MIDLCIDARMARSSGIGTCIRHIAPLLNQSPFRVILLVDRLDLEWCKNLEQILMPVSIYSVREQFSFFSKIPSCGIFWSPNYNIPLFPIRAKKRVVTIHDACHIALSQFLSFPERIYSRFVMKQALLRSDSIITDSFFSKNELVKFFGGLKNPIEVIHPAANEVFCSDIEELKVEVRRKYQLPDKFVLYVGNLKPHKNLSGLLKAFSLASIREMGLVVVGKSRGLRNYQEIEKKQNIFHIGEVLDQELCALYSMARMLVLPSFYEGFGLPPLEAMNSDCPTIVSDRASLPEICGEASLYVNPDKPEEIASAIARLDLDVDLRNELIKKGRERAKLFSWEQTASLYRDLFEKVCRT